MVDFLRAVPSFALAAFLIALIPGQGMAMVLRQALIGGRAYAYVSVLGNSTGLIVWGVASAVGLSAIFAESESAYLILKFIGVGYLLFLSAQTFWSLRNGGSKFGANLKNETKHRSAYLTGLTTNLTNVKATVFAVAVLPGFIPAEVDLRIGIIAMAGVWAVISASTYAVIVLAAHSASELLSSESARRRLTLVSAFGIAAMAVGLIFT